MRVIPEPTEGTREVLTGGGAGSQVIRGSEGSISLLCGNCRDILVKSVGPDAWFSYTYDEDTDKFSPQYRIRDIVWQCKGCGAFNEVGDVRVQGA
jgi:hypothetical protein